MLKISVFSHTSAENLFAQTLTVDVHSSRCNCKICLLMRFPTFAALIGCFCKGKFMLVLKLKSSPHVIEANKKYAHSSSCSVKFHHFYYLLSPFYV
jgi:hypothetical protein